MKKWLPGLLLVAGCAPTMAGRLTTQAGALVSSPDARVNITSLTPHGADAPAALVVAVAGDGTFSTRAELPPGDYLVEALVPGYTLASKRVKIGDDADSDDTRLTLTLKPLAQTKVSPIGVNTAVDEGRGAGGATLMPPSL